MVAGNKSETSVFVCDWSFSTGDGTSLAVWRAGGLDVVCRAWLTSRAQVEAI